MVLERGGYYLLLLWGQGADKGRKQKKDDLVTVLFFARTFTPQVGFRKSSWPALFILFQLLIEGVRAIVIDAIVQKHS
jgi:hypothetical protein